MCYILVWGLLACGMRLKLWCSEPVATVLAKYHRRCGSPDGIVLRLAVLLLAHLAGAWC